MDGMGKTKNWIFQGVGGVAGLLADGVCRSMKSPNEKLEFFVKKKNGS